MDPTGPLVVLDPPRYRHTEDGGVELWDVRRRVWQRIKPWSAPILDALEAGTDYAGLKRLAEEIPVSKNPEFAQARLKLFLFTLHRLGHIHLPRPPPPSHGRYTIVRELGRGGVAVADLARDEQTGRDVVVKRAWDFLQPYEVTENAIRHEAVVLRSFDHPGIVRLHDSFEVGPHLHIIRDLVEGSELTSYQGLGIKDHARFHGIASQLVDLVGHVHSRGYLLIDLRPANFYEQEDGSVVLLDVGQCRAHDGGTLRLDRKVGSRGFISPEMVAGDVITERSDMYALGMLLLFLRSGILTQKKPKQRRIERTLGAEDPWLSLLVSMTSQDPEARPTDTQELRQRIKRLDDDA